MKKLIIISLLLLLQSKIIGQNTELISNAVKKQNIEKIDSIARKLNYKGGDIIKVFAVFTVNENGEIKDVKARGPHKLFEEEAVRIVSLIPKLDPKEFKNGMKEMKFTLPINFQIETYKDKKKRLKKEKQIVHKNAEINKKDNIINLTIKDEDIYLFDLVEITPITIDCNPNSEKEILKKCVKNSITSHVNKTFNAGLAYKLGLKSGLHKIDVSFIISINGEIVNITTEGNNKELNAEAIKVINRLPKMTPGMVNGKIVNVKYSLPIVLLVS
ncbi:energy transducer TonB [Lutibacter sp.]|uniref:energy transducer TonB n=1 Tax=Lutibacter sp. TaxID=1925666 RepID=UPI001A239157|nr:energy transducer TonB [Lutibacter sp.]MBI9041944.1 energy transducer TonB [Lutibacter sp.]